MTEKLLTSNLYGTLMQAQAGGNNLDNHPNVLQERLKRVNWNALTPEFDSEENFGPEVK